MNDIKNIIKWYAENDYAARMWNHYWESIWQIDYDFFEDDDEKIDKDAAIENLFKRVIELENLVIELNNNLNK
jgi:hypothetical protein